MNGNFWSTIAQTVHVPRPAGTDANLLRLSAAKILHAAVSVTSKTMKLSGAISFIVSGGTRRILTSSENKAETDCST